MARSGTFQALSSLGFAGGYSIEHVVKSQELWRLFAIAPFSENGTMAIRNIDAAQQFLEGRMDFSSVVGFIKQFETTKVMTYIESMDLKTIMEHPYFLAGVGVTAIISYLMRWRLLLVVVMTITGFIYLLGYTLSKGVSLESGMPTESLLVLVGGGSFIVFLAIYLLFIRND
jgi:hypothetical protein